MDILCYSFHSVKGGVGKTSLALSLAHGLCAKGPVVLIETGPGGCSLADALPLDAPRWEGSCDIEQNILRAPTGYVNAWSISGQGTHPTWSTWMLMQRPKDVTVEDGHPAAFLWKSSSEAEHFYVVPASSTPGEAVQMHSLPPNFTTNRTGLFLNDLVGFFQGQGHQRLHVIFDTSPSLVGTSRDVLTLALTLGHPEGPRSWLRNQELPSSLDGAKITWKAFLVYGQDRGDGQALTGYLHAAPPEDILTGVLYTVGRDDTATYLIPEDPRMRFFHRDDDISSAWRNLKEMAPIITGIFLDQAQQPARIRNGQGGAQ